MSRGNHNYSEKGKNDYSTIAANKADRGIPCSSVCCCFLCSKFNSVLLFMCYRKGLKYVAVTRQDVGYVPRLCRVGNVTNGVLWYLRYGLHCTICCEVTLQYRCNDAERFYRGWVKMLRRDAVESALGLCCYGNGLQYLRYGLHYKICCGVTLQYRCNATAKFHRGWGERRGKGNGIMFVINRKMLLRL